MRFDAQSGEPAFPRRLDVRFCDVKNNTTRRTSGIRIACVIMVADVGPGSGSFRNSPRYFFFELTAANTKE